MLAKLLSWRGCPLSACPSVACYLGDFSETAAWIQAKFYGKPPIPHISITSPQLCSGSCHSQIQREGMVTTWSSWSHLDCKIKPISKQNRGRHTPPSDLQSTFVVTWHSHHTGITWRHDLKYLVESSWLSLITLMITRFSVNMSVFRFLNFQVLNFYDLSWFCFH